MEKKKSAWSTLGNRKVPDVVVLIVILPIFVLGLLAIFGTFFSHHSHHNFTEREAKTNLRSHAQGLFIFAMTHDDVYPSQDQWPDALLSEEIIYPEMLVSPIEDGDGISYIYVPGPFTEDPNQILIYEDPKHWPEKGVLVGFSDTTVRFVPFDEFEQMLEKKLAETQP